MADDLVVRELCRIRELLMLQARFNAYSAPGYGSRDWYQNELAHLTAEIEKDGQDER